MKRKAIILSLVIVLLISQGLCLNAQEQEVDLLRWLDGDGYLEIPEEIRIIYVGGLVDMFYFITYYELPETYKIYKAKMEGMKVGQIQKIFEKYLEEHPENLHYSTADSFYHAMLELVAD